MPDTTVDLINYEEVPDLPDGEVVGKEWRILVRNPETGEVWEALPMQVSAATNPVVVVLPQPLPPAFADFSDTPTGGSVRLVAADGVALTDYRYKVGADGPYQVAPTDGIITVGDVAGAVFAYSVATPTRQQSLTAPSPAFTRALVVVDPGAVTVKPPMPEFSNFRDTAAGGTVQLIPADGVPLADYRYKIGADGIYATVPADGVISVGNIDGQVFAYSVSGLNRAQSGTASSPVFTSYTVNAPGTTTPGLPFFQNFLDTNAGGSLTLVPATGIPLSDYLYKVTAEGQYQPVPPDGVISVGNVSGPVYAYSVASGTRNQGPVAVSQSFTSYTAPAPVYYNTAQTYATTAQDYTDKCGSGTGAGVSRTINANIYTSAVSVADANAQALAAATTAAKNAIVCTVVQPTTYTGSYTTTPADFTAKCGAGTTGAAVTRTATSTVSQSAADQAAQTAALAAITCPVPPPAYNTTLSTATVLTADGMSFAPKNTDGSDGGPQLLKFNLINGTSGPTISIAITALGATSYIDYASEYAGAGYAFVDANGVRHDGTFPASDNLNIAY